VRGRALAIGMGIACMLQAPSAAAFRYLACGGVPVRWPAPFGMVQNACSMPSGTEMSKAYAAVLGQWRGISGMSDMVYHYGSWPPSRCWVDVTDGWNDVALVPEGSIDGALGETVIVRQCSKIIEANVLVANLATQSFGNPDEAFATGTCPIDPTRTGQTALLHEFGHAHGLSLSYAGGPDNHSLGFTVMRPTPPVPLGGGGFDHVHSQPMPDDVAGGRFLYPLGSGATNLVASGQRLSKGNVFNNTFWQTIQRCRGDTFSFRFTTGNTGTQSVTSNQRFYLAKSPEAHTQQGITVGTWFGATINAQSAVHVPVTATIPCGTAPGLYWIYHDVDGSKAVDEASETDNVVHGALTVQVLDCGC
jgi:hypothetical protein